MVGHFSTRESGAPPLISQSTVKDKASYIRGGEVAHPLKPVTQDMSSRGKHKRKEKNTEPPPTEQWVVDQSHCQEHEDHRTDDNRKDADKNREGFVALLRNKVFDTAAAAVLISLLALASSFWQACLTRKSIRVDQRSWISIPFPTSFPLDGATIPVATHIINSGKTPAKGVVVDVFASVLKRDDKPTVGDFSVGHPHERLRAPGVIFPRDPTPVNISVGTI